MERDAAIALVRDKIDKDITFRHLVSVEGVMRRLAQHFNEDEHAWGLTGLDGSPTPWLKSFSRVGKVIRRNASFLLDAEPPRAEVARVASPGSPRSSRRFAGGTSRGR